jgi:hypothetical protein
MLIFLQAIEAIGSEATQLCIDLLVSAAMTIDQNEPTEGHPGDDRLNSFTIGGSTIARRYPILSTRITYPLPSLPALLQIFAVGNPDAFEDKLCIVRCCCSVSHDITDTTNEKGVLLSP